MKEAVGYTVAGGSSAAAGVWAMVQHGLEIGTIVCGFIAAFCGAVTGVYGFYLMIKKIRRNQYEKSVSPDGR